MTRRRTPPAKPTNTKVTVEAAGPKTVTIETRGTGKRWGKAFWLSVLSNFLLASGTIFVLQMTKIQAAINVGDWNTVKRLTLALIFGAVFALVKAFYTALNIKLPPVQNGNA